MMFTLGIYFFPHYVALYFIYYLLNICTFTTEFSFRDLSIA